MTMAVFVCHLRDGACRNEDFRRVLWTGKTFQLVLMSLRPREEIDPEVHVSVEQSFFVEDGAIVAHIEKDDYAVASGECVVVPAKSRHQIVAGVSTAKLFTIYAPPQHPPDLVQQTKPPSDGDGVVVVSSSPDREPYSGSISTCARSGAPGPALSVYASARLELAVLSLAPGERRIIKDANGGVFLCVVRGSARVAGASDPLRAGYCACAEEELTVEAEASGVGAYVVFAPAITV